MRATQYVRRGLIAFATVALVSTGVAGAVSAQSIGGGAIGCSSAGISDDGDAIVVGATPGYINCALLSTPGHGESAIIAIGAADSAFPVAIQFIPDVNGAAVINPIGDDAIAERQ